MTKKEALIQLQRLLVELYDDESKASMLADQSGIPTSAVGGRDTLATYWWNLLVAAHRRGKVQQLVMNATWDYSERGVDLKQAFSAYDGAADAGDDIQPHGEEVVGLHVDTGGGAYIGGKATITGDFVGRDQLTYGDRITVGDVSGTSVAIGRSAQSSVQTGLSGADLAAIFQAVNAQIDRRPEDPNVGKDELRDTAQMVKDEVAKGEAANTAKIERWLKQLIDLAPDVAEVALAALANPAAGVATAIAKLAQRLQASRG
jgi:TPR repeat protein